MNDFSERGTPAWWDTRYQQGDTPWNLGIVAPEVLDFCTEHPGDGHRAFDIGCGTGTHGRELARRGYRVLGIDLSGVALKQALAAARREELPWLGVQGSVTNLGMVRESFAVALDIGCFHGLSDAVQSQYAADLERLLMPGGFYLLYAAHPRNEGEGGAPGVSPEQVEAKFSPYLTAVWRHTGWQGERRADWWLWQR